MRPQQSISTECLIKAMMEASGETSEEEEGSQKQEGAAVALTDGSESRI